jgi:hypothetical protein
MTEVATRQQKVIAAMKEADKVGAVYVETPSGPGAHDDRVLAAAMASDESFSSDFGPMGYEKDYQSGTIVSSTVESSSFIADTMTSTHPSIFAPPVNTIVFTLPDDVNPELKGTFVEFGSPQPVEILNEPKDVVRGTTPFLPDNEYEAEDGSFQKQVDNFVDSVDQQGEQGPDPVVVNVDKTARDRMEMILAMEAGNAEPLPDVTELDKEIQKGEPAPLPQAAEVLLNSPALPLRVVDEKPELKPEDRILSLDDLKKQLEPTPAAVPTPEITPTTTPGAPRRKLILDFDDELL